MFGDIKTNYDRKDVYEFRKFIKEYGEFESLESITDKIKSKQKSVRRVTDVELTCLLLEDVVTRFWWEEEDPHEKEVC